MINFFRKRKIKKAIKKWKPGQTIDQLVHNMSEGLVKNLEKAGLTPKEIEKAVRDNDNLIVNAVNQGVDLMTLCEQVKDTVMEKNSALEKMELSAIDSIKKTDGKSFSIVDSVSSVTNKIGNRTKNLFKRKEKEVKQDVKSKAAPVAA